MRAYLFWFFCLLIVPGVVSAQDSDHRVTLGKLRAPVLSEVSGMVPSSRYAGQIWVHNDSGDNAKIYLIDSLAQLNATVTLGGIAAVDIEDIAWVNLDGEPHLVLADIGDNRARREEIYLYILKEPENLDQLGEMYVPAADIRICTLRYADQRARDAEAIFVDPKEQQVVLISKREFRSSVYAAPVFGQPSETNFSLQKQVELPFTFATAADISRNRDAILIKNLTHIYKWALLPHESVSDALMRVPENRPYQPEPQGEAIAFDHTGRGFYTLSERPLGLDAYLYYYLF
ncbi:MAG TPA: hypothetical protein H9825_04110 [Candidatus Sphingobacterium stercorigallinarum]|nr:hypothetical protein [Candidatus Sphingobacterium stercorigallinarum]